MFGIEEDFRQLMEQVYGPLDGGKMTEIGELKEQIKVLEKKLSFLEELEQTKSPAEEAYKDWWGEYPKSIFNNDDVRWMGFQAGYNAAQKDYKVGEHQEPIPEEELKTLYQMIYDDDWTSPSDCNRLCDIVKEWIFQYDCDYAACEDYLEGYIECQTVLEERLK